MSSGRRENPRRQGVWWDAFVVALNVAAVAALSYTFESSSSAFVHLFYVPVLAGAFFFRTAGGVAVGAMAGLLSGPARPVFGAAAMPAADWLIWTTVLVGVGYIGGRAVDTLRKQEAVLDSMAEERCSASCAIQAMDGSTAAFPEGGDAQWPSPGAESAPERVEQVRRAALLHDVGKLAVPKEVLNKPGPLDPHEWELIRRHPVESERIVGRISVLRALLPALRHHHERVDGRGYPDGVRGRELPLEARIITVADAYDAMTSRRAYREPLSQKEAVEQLLQNAGSQFDPQVVDAFLRALNISYTVRRWLPTYLRSKHASSENTVNGGAAGSRAVHI